MSYLAASAPGMEDLRKSAASIIEFADTAAITVIPVLPSDDCGPEVRLGPSAMDLPGFLALAQKLGGGVLYVRATPFDPAAIDDEPVEELPSHLTKRKGEVGYLGVAFAVNGLIHFWEQTTAWYQEWQLLLSDDAFGEADEDGPEQSTASCRACGGWRVAGGGWRVAGYEVQYFATIEPQRRLAPHAHFAIRG